MHDGFLEFLGRRDGDEIESRDGDEMDTGNDSEEEIDGDDDSSTDDSDEDMLDESEHQEQREEQEQQQLEELQNRELDHFYKGQDYQVDQPYKRPGPKDWHAKYVQYEEYVETCKVNIVKPISCGDL